MAPSSAMLETNTHGLVTQYQGPSALAEYG